MPPVRSPCAPTCRQGRERPPEFSADASRRLLNLLQPLLRRIELLHDVVDDLTARVQVGLTRLRLPSRLLGEQLVEFGLDGAPLRADTEESEETALLLRPAGKHALQIGDAGFDVPTSQDPIDRAPSRIPRV